MSIARARAGALALLLVFASAGPAAAAVFHATNGRDLPDADLVDCPTPENPPACCDAGDAVANACTLRAAIQNANLTPEEDTIVLSGITYSLSLKGSNEDDSATGDLDVTTPIIITSDDDNASPQPTTGSFATTVIDAKKLSDRIFDVKPGGSLVLEHVTVENGKTPKDDFDPGSPGEISGGCIRTEGDLHLQGMFFFTCSSVDDGGCLSVLGGETTSFGAIFSACRTKNEGGGIELGAAGAAALDRTTLFGAKAATGGAIAASGPLSLTNVTLSGNKAKTGGGLATLGAAATTVNNSTFASNGTSNVTRLGGGAVTLSNSILSYVKTDCTGGITSAGGNVVDDTSCAFASTNDVQDVDPLLFPLSFYSVIVIQGPGGNQPVPLDSPLVPTMALSQESTAIDQGIDASCAETDARGQVRDDVVDVGVAQCDSGSFEYFQP